MNKTGYIARMALVGVALLAGFVLLVRHLHALQIGRNEELLGKARAKYTASRTYRGVRGAIYDIHGNLLAGNLACRDVLVEPRWLRRLDDRQLEEVVAVFSRELGAPEEILRRRFVSSAVEVVAKRDANLAEVTRLQAWIGQFNELAREESRPRLQGVRYVDTQIRFYPKHSLCANLIGFTDVDGRGVAGIEQIMDERLAPTEGKTVFERDRLGVQLGHGNPTDSIVRDGWNVYLTIDEPIQSIVEEELATLCETHLPQAAYILMANPKTGAIMAMAQAPTFNPNQRTGVRPEQWQNRMLTHGVEPGSIMKCVSIAGALDYDVVNLGTVFDCEKGLWFHAGRPLRDAGKSYEDMRVWEIVQKSSNIGTAKIALKMGDKRLYETLRRFGFGEPVGIGFPDEAPGIFRTLRNWDGLSISRFAIGQGILTTPLQMVQAYCALANDGIMMQLRVVDRLEDPATGVVELHPGQVKRRVIRRSSAHQIVAAMKTVTRPGGTATRAAVEGYEVAGKTGTAQKFVNGTYNSGRYVASFAGFVPADDPAFVLLILVDEPSGGSYYGGTVAGPAFSRISERTLRYLQVAPATPNDTILIDERTQTASTR